MSNSDLNNFSLSNVLDDLSLNIYNLKNNYNVNDISNQIINLGNNIQHLNAKIEEVLNLYDTINELNLRVKS